MKKLFIVIAVVLISYFTVLAAPKNEKVPDAVNMFISNLEKLSQLSDSQRDTAYDLNEQNARFFAAGGDSRGGITIDSEHKYNSELYYLGLGKVSNSLTYCNKLYTMLYKEKVLKLKHEILYTEAINVMDAHGKDELYFYVTKLKKTCEYNNETIVLWQAFEVNASDGLIDRIEGYNVMPASWSGGYANNKVGKSIIEKSIIPEVSEVPEVPEVSAPSNYSTNENVKMMTEQEYLRLAAYYYTAKDYEAAGTTYQQLTAVYPNNAEGWFRLACLVRYEKRWSNDVYANPKKKAIEFMEKASNLAVGKLKSKAENALFYWKNENYM